jgi:hypothetical protein
MNLNVGWRTNIEKYVWLFLLELRCGHFLCLWLTVGVTKKIGEDVADELDLGNTVGEWLRTHASNIRKMFEDEPPDLKGAIDQLLDIEAPESFVADGFLDI